VGHDHGTGGARHVYHGHALASGVSPLCSLAFSSESIWIWKLTPPIFWLQNDLLKKFRDQLKQEGILSKSTGGSQPEAALHVCLSITCLCSYIQLSKMEW
jgi:hypothetical protein